MTGHAPHAEELAPVPVLLKPFVIDRLGEMLARVLDGRADR